MILLEQSELFYMIKKFTKIAFSLSKEQIREIKLELKWNPKKDSIGALPI